MPPLAVGAGPVAAASEEKVAGRRDPSLRAPLRRAVPMVVDDEVGQLVGWIPAPRLERGIPVLKLQPKHTLSASAHFPSPKLSCSRRLVRATQGNR